MIFDTISNFKYYSGLNKKFQKAFDFILSNDLSKYENGVYEIDGDEIYVSIQDYNTKTKEEANFEAHKKYADVQLILMGEEQLGYGNILNFKEITDYNDEKDIVFLEGDGCFIKATVGDFLIFFPQDVHMPCISLDKPTYVKKAVFKIKL